MERTGGGFPPRAASTPMDPRATRKAAASSSASACACACASYRPKLFSKRDVVFGGSQSDLSPLVQRRTSRGGRRRRMRSAVLLRHWSLAVFLLCSPVAPDGRTADALGGRMRRSVSHAQLMHDKGRSMQELKRRLWLQELLEEVHTAEERPPPAHGGGASPDFSGNDLRQKPPEATKDLPHRSGPEREGPVLPQETHKASAYKDQPLKVATKRKKKARLGRRRDGDKKRRRTRSVPTPD